MHERIKAGHQTFKNIITSYDPEPVELFTALLAIGWGLWLLNPAFDTFAGADTYIGMEELASEGVWGAILAGHGVTRWHATLLGTAKQRQNVAFIGFLIWAFIAISVVHAAPAAAAVPICSLYALASGWVYVRLGRRSDLCP